MGIHRGGQGRRVKWDDVYVASRQLRALVEERRATLVEWEAALAQWPENGAEDPEWQARRARWEAARAELEKDDEEVSEIEVRLSRVKPRKGTAAVASALGFHSTGLDSRAEWDNAYGTCWQARQLVEARRVALLKWEAVLAQWPENSGEGDEDPAWKAELAAWEAARAWLGEHDRRLTELAALMLRLKPDCTEKPVASPGQAVPRVPRLSLPRPSLNNIWLFALVAYPPYSLLYFLGPRSWALVKNVAVYGWLLAIGLWFLAWWLLGTLGKRTAPPPRRRGLSVFALSLVAAIEFLVNSLLNTFGRPNPWTPSKIVDVAVRSVCVVLALVALWLRGREERAEATARRVGY